MYAKKGRIYPAYISKHNSNCKKQVIILMIPNREGLHYIRLNKIPTSLRGITSNDNALRQKLLNMEIYSFVFLHFCRDDGDFYCLNCIHNFDNGKQT